ncbi:hypothetical protein PRIPAC_93911 [Pristionchus pacificus]|uniref:Carbohydrate-binding protein n=1 Tax=Pristionchus pacificus TaxID=54126 RepID=A0A2A6BJ55_PRIPA|nr:hypothetical protein PRIPAC_93911 [Pristionchus pacificus]|eukprot:PDM65940.1 Carbohydrate-binding protein [Pristionchus pacificus]
MAVKTLVTTPDHKVCATSFVICKEGEVTAVMNCPDGTFFNEKTKEMFIGCEWIPMWSSVLEEVRNEEKKKDNE